MSLNTSESGQAISDPESRRWKRRRIWRVVLGTGAYFVLGLVVFIFVVEAQSEIVDGSPLIDDPVERERIDSLDKVGLWLWLAGFACVLIGSWVTAKASQTSKSIRRAFQGAMILVPILWLLFSIWLIRESMNAVDSNPVPVEITTWLASPPNERSTNGWPGHVSLVLLHISDNQVQPSEITIPANIPIGLAVGSFDQDPHTFTIAALGIDIGPVPRGWPTVPFEVINVPVGTYVSRCTEPGHEDEAGVTIHVIDVPVVADLTYDGKRLTPESASINSNELVAIRVTNASGADGNDMLFSIPGMKIHNGVSEAWIDQGETVLLILSAPAGEYRFWGYVWHDSEGAVKGIPGGTLLVRDSQP